MRMPKWECPDVSQVKIKMGPNWDQHGNAQVGVPKWFTWDQCRQPHLQIETWDPLGSEVGSSWKIVCGSQLGPTCITQGQTHLGPMWAPRTKQWVPLGLPKWDPLSSPLGLWHSCWGSHQKTKLVRIYHKLWHHGKF